jgi:hypothetical protein
MSNWADPFRERLQLLTEMLTVCTAFLRDGTHDVGTLVLQQNQTHWLTNLRANL